MAELENLASLTALLSKQPASDSDNQVAVQENSQTKETNTPISGMTQVFHGGYTFFRVPFQSSTSSNADILATCKSHGLLAPCDSVATQYAICGGCTEIPIEAHASQQPSYHFGHGEYNPNTYSWPGGLEGWRNFFLRPSSLHIFANNPNDGCQKSTRARSSHDWMYQGASHGFCLCAIKGKPTRQDTSDYVNRHAEQANPILDMLDAIRIKISTNAAKGIKELDTAKVSSSLPPPQLFLSLSAFLTPSLLVRVENRRKDVRGGNRFRTGSNQVDHQPSYCRPKGVGHAEQDRRFGPLAEWTRLRFQRERRKLRRNLDEVPRHSLRRLHHRSCVSNCSEAVL